MDGRPWYLCRHITHNDKVSELDELKQIFKTTSMLCSFSKLIYVDIFTHMLHQFQRRNNSPTNLKKKTGMHSRLKGLSLRYIQLKIVYTFGIVSEPTETLAS